MADWTSRFREWLGIPHTPDAEKDQVERTLREQHRRLDRIDAGIPVRARRDQLFPHPNRRASDRH
jgi:hypothetical protein